VKHIAWQSALLWAVAFVLGAAMLHHVLVCLTYPYPLEYPEGVTAMWVQRAADGLPLYPAENAASALHNPYPPLFYRLVAAAQTACVHPFAASRLAGLLGWVAACLALYQLLPGTRRAQRLAVLATFALSITVLRYACMARVDMPALACALGAVAWLRRRGGWALGGAAALAAAAMLFKPSLAAATLVGTCVALRRGRGSLLLWCTVWGGACAAGLLIGGAPPADLFRHLVVLNRLPLDPLSGLSRTAMFVSRHPVIVLGYAALILSSRLRHDPRWWYAMVSLTAVPLACKLGADQNYYVELIACGAIGLAALVADTPHAAPVLTLLLAAQLALYLPIEPAPVFTRTYDQELTGGGARFTPRADDVAVGHAVVAELARGKQVLAQSPGLLLAAGQDIVFQPYQYTQLSRLGRWDAGPLAAAVASNQFDLVMLKADADDRANYVPQAVLDAVEATCREYRHIGPYMFYVPTGE